MKIVIQNIAIIFLLTVLTNLVYCQKKHPNLLLTNEDVSIIKAELAKAPLFKKSLNEARLKINAALNEDIIVPIPKDAGGGYTHEKHKKNYNEMFVSGALYQLTGEKKYLIFLKSMLDKYAELYPTLGTHPQGKKQIPGRLFWQSLNETVWLLHTIQAYDCIYDDLSEEDRENYESNIFNPMAKFFMDDCRHSFDLIHNHGTWIVAAVGMTGFVLGNDDYVNKSIYGYNEKGESGFLAQLKKLFSPDGYYTEGGYYARYALWPFFIFAESIKNNLPELNIYEFRNRILKKAFNSALQVTYTNGEFIPINDALKEKTWLTSELVFASNFTYSNYENDKSLLNLVKLHDRVSLNGAGFKVAIDLEETANIPEFKWHSVKFTDGPNGNQGGVTILRNGKSSDQSALLLKYGSHGLSHGHFDKLNILYYDQGREILQDYGAARFLNIEQKDGGRYLPENETFAKQTIAHNTVVINEQSQYKGKRSLSEANHSEKYAVNFDNVNFQYASAKENNAYKDVQLHRTVCLLNDENFTKPIVIDILNIISDEEHQYDLPYYYKGHFLSTNIDYKPFITKRSLLGEKNGYQHIWKEAHGKANGLTKITWLNGERFYTLLTNTDGDSEVFFTRIGGSDPNFNLRNEPGVVVRRRGESHCFASVLEPHGSFDPILEKTEGSEGIIKEIKVLRSDDEYTIAQILGKKNDAWSILICNNNAQKDKKHELSINNIKYSWIGPIAVRKI